MHVLLLTVSFGLICLASYRVGQWFSAIRLPYITGYLFVGALVGSFGLDLIPTEAAERLRFVDQLSLAVIAFVAGSELYLKDLRSRLRTILSTTLGIVLVVLLLIGVSLYLLTAVIPFTADLSVTGRLAVAVLGATVLLALSPPSTIAVIKEVRARGPFTSTALSVTVFMDVLIIVLFAITTSIAATLLTGTGFNPGFVLLLALDLSLALLLGYATGRLFKISLAQSWPNGVQLILLLGIGYLIFFAADQVATWSQARFGVKVYLEPLLVAMVAGFFITNYTPSRKQFDHLLHQVGPAVYVAFFTLTGISLKLDLLWQTLPIALLLFGLRMAGIGVGAFLGGRVAGESKSFTRWSWMAFITQAGIALGLAREAAIQFPSLGTAFATLIISVVVLNEVFGPLLLKYVLQRVGEAQIPETGRPHERRRALILGIEAQSIGLARQLRAHGWRVVLADTDASHVDRLNGTDLESRLLPSISESDLQALINDDLDALVAMLDDDVANLRACELARMLFGTSRFVVRPQDFGNAEAFRSIGALVVNPASAMTSLLDQAVRAPQSATLLLQADDQNRDVIQVTVANPEVDGYLVRDLGLPEDVLLVDLTRDGASILPSGYTRLRLSDEITLIGEPERLDEVTLRLGY